MSILDKLSKMYADKRELALLELMYCAMSVFSVVAAGIVALFDQSMGVAVLIVPLVAVTAMCMNVVAWALIKLAADTFLPKKKDGKKK